MNPEVLPSGNIRSMRIDRIITPNMLKIQLEIGVMFTPFASVDTLPCALAPHGATKSPARANVRRARVDG